MQSLQNCSKNCSGAKIALGQKTWGNNCSGAKSALEQLLPQINICSKRAIFAPTSLYFCFLLDHY